jgi:hypothetical protein
VPQARSLLASPYRIEHRQPGLLPLTDETDPIWNKDVQPIAAEVGEIIAVAEKSLLETDALITAAGGLQYVLGRKPTG